MDRCFGVFKKENKDEYIILIRVFFFPQMIHGSPDIPDLQSLLREAPPFLETTLLQTHTLGKITAQSKQHQSRFQTHIHY